MCNNKNMSSTLKPLAEMGPDDPITPDHLLFWVIGVDAPMGSSSAFPPASREQIQKLFDRQLGDGEQIAVAQLVSMSREWRDMYYTVLRELLAEDQQLDIGDIPVSDK
jgi:hypothetical protein